MWASLRILARVLTLLCIDFNIPRCEVMFSLVAMAMLWTKKQKGRFIGTWGSLHIRTKVVKKRPLWYPWPKITASEAQRLSRLQTQIASKSLPAGLISDRKGGARRKVTSHYRSISLDTAESEYLIFSQLMRGFPATAISGSSLMRFN